jgi:hypothetical protein
MSYKKFTVYSNEKIDDNIKTILDNAINLVEKSELCNPNYKYNIILCNSSFYNKTDDKLLGVGTNHYQTKSLHKTEKAFPNYKFLIPNSIDHRASAMCTMSPTL